jgi:hypothetical protein
VLGLPHTEKNMGVIRDVPLRRAALRPHPQGDAGIILTRPLSALTEPLEVFSSVLGETVWMVATDEQAAAIQAKGGTAYMPEEVAILRDLYAAVKPEVWAERLRLIHEAKKRFRGRLEP